MKSGNVAINPRTEVVDHHDGAYDTYGHWHPARSKSEPIEIVQIGANSSANRNGAITLGASAVADHEDSIALGRGTTTTRVAQVTIGPRDLEITDPAKGVVLVSPNGTRYRITVSDDGSLNVIAA